MVSGLWMWAVSDIKLVTSVECGVGYCMRFALIFVKIWEIVSCVEIPGCTIATTTIDRYIKVQPEQYTIIHS